VVKLAEPQLVPLSGTNTPDDNRISMSVHITPADPTEAEGTKPPVVFCHGFPDLGYSWRHQVPAVAAAGFTSLAPDQRGYGSTTAPEDVSAYALDSLCGDLADLLDSQGIDQAIFVGHDWGGFVAWAMPVLFPARTAGVVGVCTPNTPFPTTDFLLEMFGEPEKMYMLWFQEPGVAESHLDSRVPQVFEKLLVGGIDPAMMLEAGMGRAEGMDFNPFRRIDELEAPGQPVVTREDLDHYVDVFARTGFRNAINWYRNIDDNDRRFHDVGRSNLEIPTLMITSEWDPALPPALAAKMGGLCSDLETHMIERTGHWVHEEEPDKVNVTLVDWLVRRFG
jgi:pimeloyl-ACP methyl ester carboxylesterase